MEVSDKDECTVALSSYERLLSNKDICEGDCVRGQNCPTGGAKELLIFIFDFSVSFHAFRFVLIPLLTHELFITNTA